MPDNQSNPQTESDTAATATNGDADRLTKDELEAIRRDLIQYNTQRLELKHDVATRSANIFVKELRRAV